MARKAANQREKLRIAQNSKTQTQKSKQTPPEQTQCKHSPLKNIITFLLSTTGLAKSSTNFVHILSPFGNELIKHNPREAGDAMHEIKIRVLHKVYKQVFKQLYSIIMPRLANQE
jgi:hypothetical protein